MNTTENNKLIAEFIKLKSVKTEWVGTWFYIKGEGYVELDSFKYHTSWDWLMPVVEKIESLGYRIEIVKHICRIMRNEEILFVTSENLTKIESTYHTLLEFIKWLNENKN